MNYPFLIWTVQRTGSTALADICYHLSDKNVKHEPFNVDREFPYNGKDELLQQLKKLKGEDFCFKHCWNVHRPMFNQLILDFFLEEGHKVILLSRSNVLAMEISRQLAKQTGVWGKKSGKEHRSYIDQEFLPIDIVQAAQSIGNYVASLNEYRAKLEQANIEYFTLSYEKIFEASMEQRFSLIEKLSEFLDIPSKNIEDKKADLVNLIKDNKQNTIDVYKKIPNIGKLATRFPEYRILA